MSGSSTPSNREELMFLGTTCHQASCNLNDFLPFSCPACKLSFCQPHFLPSQHQCKAPLPASMVDRIAPSCPLCNEVVSYPPGGKLDPNEAVERHILSGTCTGMEGGEARKKAELKRRKEKGEVCFRRGCNKVLVVPMNCEACRRSFCPSHRTASSHSCGVTPNTSGTSTPQPQSRPSGNAKTAGSRLLQSLPSVAKPTAKPTTTGKLPSSSAPAHKPNPIAAVQAASPQLEARAAAAAAAMKRAGQDVKVPFVKTKQEKRANAETQSQIQALKARHDKGLLSKAEEVRYAELVGKRESGRRSGEKDKDCIIA